MSERPHTSVDQQIRSDIAAAIFEQRLAPGTKLSEAGLGDIYGVSRTVVRKALFHLAADKLVDIRPNRGAIVWQPNPAEAHEVFAARRVLETALLAESLPRMDAGDHAELADCLAADIAAHAARDRQSMIRASGDFHRRLAAPSGNGVLLAFLDELIGRSSLIVALYEARDTTPCSHHDHDALLAVIHTGDVARAQSALAAHLQDCQDRLVLDAPPARAPALADLLGRSRRA